MVVTLFRFDMIHFCVAKSLRNLSAKKRKERTEKSFGRTILWQNHKREKSQKTGGTAYRQNH